MKEFIRAFLQGFVIGLFVAILGLSAVVWIPAALFIYGATKLLLWLFP